MDETTLMKKLLAILILLVIPVVVAAQGPEPLVGDAFQRTGLLWGSNSLYAIGDTAVGVIFVESDGTIDPNTEDWTTQEKNKVIAGIIAGTAWWVAREPRADLTFTIEYTQAGTGYEPITRSHVDDDLWIYDTLTEMGYSGATTFYLVDDYNNALRNQYQTDWAFTIFVIDSSNDLDGMHTDLRFAYAILGGPYMSMTYDNGNWGIADMEMVTAHEVGHIFYALDQLASSFPTCEQTSGYLNVPNHNSAKCPWMTYPSIMKWPYNSYPAGLVDKYARGQIGWWDWNCNGVLDPIDPNVETDYCFYTHLSLILRAY